MAVASAALNSALKPALMNRCAHARQPRCCLIGRASVKRINNFDGQCDCRRCPLRPASGAVAIGRSDRLIRQYSTHIINKTPEYSRLLRTDDNASQAEISILTDDAEASKNCMRALEIAHEDRWLTRNPAFKPPLFLPGRRDSMSNRPESLTGIGFPCPGKLSR
ncbi:hypothetical protein [Collimonas silvisoli]|uniref:hypothetical protein n=1 Tax=Collimonas silvisoli TaxID=2825884 RepID=UPI001B8C40BE|nr:hypothetical protein [Collimonas silvisoli]